MMTLIGFKWLTAALIALITLSAGYASLRFIQRYQHFLAIQIGDALADGIFLGAAAFHLFPQAINGLKKYIVFPIGVSLLLTLCGFCFLFFL